MPTVIITSRRLGITHTVIEGQRIPLNAPVELDEETARRVWALPGMRVAKVGAGLEDLTVPELKEQAKGKGIEGFNSMKRHELIAALIPPADRPSEGNDDNPGDGESGEPGFAGGDAPSAPPATT
jgi:hypothetical protein